MSFLTSLENFLKETEADVETLIVDIKKGFMVAESDLAAAMKWIVANAPTIAKDVSGVTAVVTELGVAGNSEVAAAVEAANIAVTALNAAAAATASGKNPAQAIVSGYVAVKQAQAAVASASAAVAAAPVTPTITSQ